MLKKLILTLMFFTVVVKSYANDFQEDVMTGSVEWNGLVFEILSEEEKTVVLVDVNGQTDISIPGRVNCNGADYWVVSFKEGLFRGNGNIEYVSVPTSVRSFETGTFAGCTGLKRISLPEGLTTISDDLFRGCTQLDSVYLPASIYSIGDNAFRDCSGLTFITIPGGASSIGDGAFADCLSLSGMDLPESLTSIGSFLFQNCKGLKSFTIPVNVYSIGEKAFANCSSLGTLSVPSKITDIDDSAFMGCVNVDTLYWASSQVSPYVVTRYCKSNLKYTGLDNRLAAIGEKAFESCAGLTEIVIPNDVKSIGDSAFAGCTGLTSIKLPLPLANIGSSVFESCIRLEAVMISDNVYSIGERAFADCSGIKTLTTPVSLAVIDSTAFEGCTNIDTLYWGCMTVSPYIVTQYCRSSLRYVQLDEELRIIGERAFEGCTGVTSFTVPANIAFIASNAFYGCDNITSFTVDSDNPVFDSRDNCNAIIRTVSNTLLHVCKSTFIPATVNIIGEKAFAGHNEFSQIDIPEGVVEIGPGAFKDCKELKSVSVPSSVVSIGEYAFGGCSELASIILPGSLTRIGDYAFDDCGNLTEIYCLARSCPSAQTNSFRNVQATLFVPLESVFNYRSEKPWSFIDLIVPFCFNETEQVTLSDDGYATFYCSYADYEIPSAISAYVITSVNNGKLVYELLSEGESGGVIPQGVAVMLKSKQKGSATYDLKFRPSGYTYDGNNLLLGSDIDTVTFAYRSCTFYKLSYGPTGTELDSVPGWYWGADEGAAFGIAGHKAWLAVPNQALMRVASYGLDNDETIVGSDSYATSHINPEDIYDMSGRMLAVPGMNGVYIINGRQVMVRP